MWTKYVLWEERLHDDGKEFNIFRIITTFGSLLSSVVRRNAHVIITLLVLACEKWCQTHIVLCCFVLSSSCALCTQCCQCFSRFYPTFINKTKWYIVTIAFPYMLHTMSLHMQYIRTLSENIHFIFTSSRIGRKKQALGKLFWPVSQRVQINFIFTDDVRIMCFYWHIKKSRRTAKLSEKSWNKHVF